MPTVTAIKPQKNNPSRFSIFLDGNFAFGLDETNLVKSGLKKDKKISLKEVEDLIYESEFGKLYDRALRFLSFRPRSEGEMRNYFAKKRGAKILPHLIEEVILKLKDARLLDDSDFASWWTKQRLTGHTPRGKRAIFFELLQKGVSREATEKVLNEVVEETELNAAFVAAQRRLRSSTSFSSLQIKKLKAYLSRRGFSWDIINTVVDRVLVEGVKYPRLEKGI